MTFAEYFSNHPDFRLQQGIFFQDTFVPPEFVKHYLTLREQEGRLLADNIVEQLPVTSGDNPMHAEWLLRKKSAEKLVRYLQGKRVHKVMEIGCGNGWLTNYLCKSLAIDCLGVDVNSIELEQAGRIFSRDGNPSFACGDVLSSAFDSCKADVIVLASVIQYFSDLPALIDLLINRLNPGGEIHIIDSPVYPEEEVDSARKRSHEYFGLNGHAAMHEYYHHHTWRSFQRRGYAVLSDPSSAIGKIRRLFSRTSPFPWVMVPGKDWE